MRVPCARKRAVNARDALDARDASHPHRVTARVGIDGAARTVGIEIGDTGGGIPSDVLPRLFEPFFTTKEAGKGTGLGLSISWGIVSDMGGQITADNTAEGALFKVTFPLADPAEASDEDETASSTREPDLADQARALLAAAAAD